MRIGIIAEGRGDQAVLCNICYGLGLAETSDDFAFIRPEYNFDATDRHSMSADEFSSWTLVRQDCMEGKKFKTFFDDNPLLENRIILIQIDTAECELKNYEVERPTRDDKYCSILRERVIAKIRTWLGEQQDENIFYAVCIEETEAWVYALYEDKDTSLKLDAKRAFGKLLQAKRKDKNFKKKEGRYLNKGAFVKMDFYSDEFSRLDKAKVRKKLKNNQSLQDFVNSLQPLLEQ